MFGNRQQTKLQKKTVKIVRAYLQKIAIETTMQNHPPNSLRLQIYPPNSLRIKFFNHPPNSSASVTLRGKPAEKLIAKRNSIKLNSDIKLTRRQLQEILHSNTIPKIQHSAPK